MIKPLNGALWQWDTGRRVKLAEYAQEVHFCLLASASALVTVPYEYDGDIVADVPNILLQEGADILVYAVKVSGVGERTTKRVVLPVQKRAKPEDYVYTETEHLTVECAVKEALQAAKESGDFKGDKGDKGDAGSIEFIVVSDLPTQDTKNAIYLVPTADGAEGNAYDEYIYSNGAWEKIGSASVEIDLSQYLEKNTDKSDYMQVYAKGTSGANQMVNVCAGGSGWVASGIPRYSSGGCITVGKPTYTVAATNKEYVDGLIAKLETKITELTARVEELGG